MIKAGKRMADTLLADVFVNNLGVVITVLVILIGLLILYYVLIIQAIIQMLRSQVSNVLLTFSFLSLIPFPPIIILGIMILIIWHNCKADFLSE